MARRTKGEDLPAGISRRHARTCPARETDDMEACRCRPRYQAQAGPRRARQTKTWPTLSAAKTWKRDVDGAFERGEARTGRVPTLREAASAWLAAATAGVVLARGDKRYRPSTLRGYRRCMEAELYPAFGSRALDRIARKELNEFVMRLAARGLAASTIRNIVIPLRALYRHAIEDLEQIPPTANPTRGVRVPAGSGRRMNFLAPAEIAPTLAALDERDRALWATAVYAGLRRGELMALRWADVDLAAGVIHVRLSYDPGEKATGEVKSAAGQDRKVPICATLYDHLIAHRQRAGARPTGLVFARGSLGGAVRGNHGPPDGPFSDQSLGQRAKRRWNTAGLRPVGLHDCRHTFASLMIAATASAGTFNPKTIQAMLGHASIQQTYDRYGHLFPGAEEEAARMLDAYLDRGGERSELAEAASRLLAALEHADPDAALPEVTQTRDALESWLEDRSAIPSVSPSPSADCERPASVQRMEIRRVR